jgi:RHS repeat-associated protein
VSETDFDLLSNRLRHAALDGGSRWTLQDVVGKPLRAWDSRSHAFRTTYDALRRPTQHFVTGADPARPGVELLTERIVYGEQLADAAERNLRGKPYLHLDQAGVVACEEHDFKGNLVRSTRRLVTAYDNTTDWTGVDPADPADPAGLLEPDIYESRTAYDAMNRPTLLTTPQAPGMAADGVRYGYNEAGLLDRVDVNVQSESGPDGRVWTAFVTNIDYDAKAQRTRVEHGNGAVTESGYDATTFRLRSLDTRVAGDLVQGLRYAYDPVGNVTLLRDEAQQTLFFRNQRVTPDRSYRYDPLYRLVEASGREHIGAAAATPHSHDDRIRLGLPHPGDFTAMARYSEQYDWDLAGNLRQMRHRGTDPATPGWTRDFSCEEPSSLEVGALGNRLSHTSLDGGVTRDAYGHDSHGNMVAMPAAQVLAWDHKDLLRQVTRQAVDADDADGIAHVGEQTYYASDLAGTRVRRVTQASAGAAIEERIYFGGFEIFRKHTGASAGLVRTTLHVMDDQAVVALVENRNGVADGTDQRVIRYQLADHLGSSGVELDSAGEVLSYEEYSPFGSTTYQAILGAARAPKRYRFLGKERDEESGLCLLGARYYAPWLARWISCDPAGAAEGPNLYVYSRDNPVSRQDDGGHQSQEALKQRRRDIIKNLGDELKKKEPDYGRAAMQMNGLNNGDIRDQVGKALQGKTKAESHAILQSLYTGAIKQPGVGEKANIVTQLEKYDPKQSLTKPAAVAPAADAAKKDEKYKFIVAINVSSKTKFGDKVDTSQNPGHTFIVLKDASGKVVKSFSYGPTEHSIRAGLACGIEGTTGYGLKGQDQYNLYEYEITKDQYDKAVKKIDEIDKAPGRFNATHQCTTTSLEVADAAGVSLPSGKTGMYIPLCEEPASVSTPLGLDRELRAKGLTPMTVPATEFKDSMNVK